MISVFASQFGKEEVAHIGESICNQWAGMGPKVKAFEKIFAQRLGLPNFLMLDSGSNALYLACSLLDLPKGSEIIVPSFTWISCAHSIILSGHRPVFCDVELETFNVSQATIAPHITKKTGAIMVVHYAGLPVDMESIEEFGFPIIEDAAHAVDSKYRGRYCGGIGALGVYSFDAIKNLAVGEGGGLSAKNEKLAKKARALRYCGIEKSGFEASTNGKERWWEYNISDVFIKMTPTDVAAGMGLGQLEKLDAFQAYRKHVWRTYQEEFSGFDWIITPPDAPPSDQHSFFTYCIRVPKRDQLAHYLYEQGIYSTVRYHPLHMNSIFGSSKRLANSEKLNEEALNIPLHARLSESDIEHIVSSIKSFSRYL